MGVSVRKKGGSEWGMEGGLGVSSRGEQEFGYWWGHANFNCRALRMREEEIEH